MGVTKRDPDNQRYAVWRRDFRTDLGHIREVVRSRDAWLDIKMSERRVKIVVVDGLSQGREYENFVWYVNWWDGPHNVD
jgi:hypothetical protein